MNQQPFTCGLCGGEYLTETTDAECLMEYQELFSEEERADAEMPVVICHDCFERLRVRYRRFNQSSQG